MTKAITARALFYTRDSGGKHETTPSQYVEWAAREAAKRKLAFRGTAADIERMIRDREAERGDLFLDWDVKGNQLTRPALDRLFARLKSDRSVSHLFIPRRDRLARPDEALDGVTLENAIRRRGVTLVYTNAEAKALAWGKSQDLSDLLQSTIDFHQSGQFRIELAEKMIQSQLALARMGLSAGGRACFGFKRHLIRMDGTIVRRLADGEVVRMPGHHVAWLPYEPEIALATRIIGMLEKMPAGKVARVLNDEKIPSPDAGRFRTDNGIRHRVSGLWNHNTITGIGRNSLLAAVASYGRRSMGDRRRHSAEGPRELEEHRDLRADGKLKVVRNKEADVVKATARFDPVLEPERFAALQQELDRRGGTQRGRTRSVDQSRNPLGGRIFDMNCGALMYRVPVEDSFKYRCSLYMQSHGQTCSHNPVPGPQASQFVLAFIRQRLLLPDALQRLEARLREFATAEATVAPDDTELDRLKSGRADLDEQIALAQKNLARAKSDEQYAAVAAEYETLRAEQQKVARAIAEREANALGTVDVETEVESALTLVKQLTGLADAASEDFGAATKLFELLNARLFVKFEQIQPNKRKINIVAGGVITLGSAPPPVEPYAGPTGRNRLKTGGGVSEDAAPQSGISDDEKSLGNPNRGDRI